jgi:hypothetical protein
MIAMSAVTAIDKQMTDYLVQLSPKQKKAVLTVVRTFVEEPEQEYSPWKDAGFLAEMDKRIEELESGKVKGSSWGEVKQRARQSVKMKKK